MLCFAMSCSDRHIYVWFIHPICTTYPVLLPIYLLYSCSGFSIVYVISSLYTYNICLSLNTKHDNLQSSILILLSRHYYKLP